MYRQADTNTCQKCNVFEGRAGAYEGGTTADWSIDLSPVKKNIPYLIHMPNQSTASCISPDTSELRAGDDVRVSRVDAKNE